ncbi:MAG: DUF342 domain-containing protein [Gammaproteobacteria bacterium]|nr:DUF342 domain-containing protein [Gammaproteobacteria bacterium]
MPPAPTEKLRMQLSPNGRRVQVVVEPRAEVTLTPNDILEQLKIMGYGDWAVLKEAVTKLPKLFTSIREPTLADIAEKRDAEMTLTISSNELTAQLTLTPARGGETVSEADVFALLTHNNVTQGIIPSAVAQAVSAQLADQVLVAQGTLPIDGEDARFESQLPEITDRRPKENSNGSVDYREISMFFTVKPDTPLLRKIPLTIGTAGTSVTGKIIPATPGRDLSFSAPLSGVKYDAEDKDLLLSAIGGQAVMIEHGVRVEPVIELKDVDLSSGNIDFDGTVNVGGDVASGLRIRTSGDIFVAGTVEGATLEAGGNIKVNKGVIGRGELRQQDNTPGASLARLKAEGSIQARFVENAMIEAHGDVMIDELLAHCEVVTEGTLMVGKDKAKKGHILGGSITAVRGIKAQVVGSGAGVRTKLEAGISRSLRKDLDQARETIIVKCAERDKVAALLKRSTQLPAELVARARATLLKSEAELKNLIVQRDAIQQQIGQDINARITIGLRVHDGTTVLLGEKTLTVDRERGPGTFTLSEGEIVYTPH